LIPDTLSKARIEISELKRTSVNGLKLIKGGLAGKKNYSTCKMKKDEGHIENSKNANPDCMSPGRSYHPLILRTN